MKLPVTSLTVSLLAMAPALAQAEQPTLLLPKMTVEGQLMRPGTTGVMPDLGGINDSAALLTRVPGANVNANGPLSGIAQYRGLYGDRISVSSDGANYKPACANSMDAPLSHVPASLTDSLKVYRGISPVSSGIETLGGAVIQETRKGDFALGDEIEFGGKLSGGYNHVNDGRYASLFGSLANQNHRIHLGGSQERGNDYEFKGGTNIPTQHDRDAATLGYGFKYGEHEFSLGYNHNDTGTTGTPSLPMDIVYSRGGVSSAEYKGTLADDYQITARIQYQNVRHAMDNFSLRGKGKKVRRSDNEADGFGYKFALKSPLLGGLLQIGTDGDNSNHSAVITNPDAPKFKINSFIDTERDRYGWFAEWEGELYKNWDLELGGRVNYIQMDSGNVNASIANTKPPVKALMTAFNAKDHQQDDVNFDLSAIVRHSFSSSLDFEFGLARKTRSPSYQERYIWLPLSATGGLGDGKNYIGDIGLKPEKSYQVEFALNWREGSAYFGPRIFYRYIDDYIQGDPTTNAAAIKIDPNTLQFKNIDAYLYGFDLEGGIVLADHWRVDGILSYVRGRRADKGDNLYRIAPFNGRLEVFYDAANWSAGTEVVAYTAQNDVSKFNKEVKTSGYTLLHLRGQYKPQFKYLRGLEIGFGVENVLDKKYRVHLSGLNRAANNVGTAVGQHLPGPGRNAYATVSYDW